jgi:hypothetical protein
MKAVTKLEPKKTVTPKDLEGEVLAPFKQNTKGMREVLFYEMQLIREGKSNPTRANAMAKMVTGVVETVRLEMEMERHAQRYPHPEGESTPAGPTPKDL